MLLFGVGMPAEHRTGALYESKSIIKPIDERKVVGFVLRSEGPLDGILEEAHQIRQPRRDGGAS